MHARCAGGLRCHLCRCGPREVVAGVKRTTRASLRRSCAQCILLGASSGGCASNSAFSLALSCSTAARTRGDSLSIAWCRGNRSCVEGIFLKLTVEKRSFGRLWQIARTEVIEAPHKGALHTGHIGFTERFDAGQLLRVRQGGSST